eukprot:scaffold876_cov243-Pinguiococcus_pyrenoidosus.AAC.8
MLQGTPDDSFLASRLQPRERIILLRSTSIPALRGIGAVVRADGGRRQRHAREHVAARGLRRLGAHQARAHQARARRRAAPATPHLSLEGLNLHLGLSYLLLNRRGFAALTWQAELLGTNAHGL